MKNKFILILIISIAFYICFPTTTHASGFLGNEYSVIKSFDDTIVEENCTGLLNGFEKDLEGILKIIRIIAPLLVILLSVYEFIVAIANKDDDALKKANSRLIRRLILVVVLFLLPTLLNLLLMFINENYTTCIQ